MSCYGEREPDIHAAGIVLYGRVKKFLELRKGHNLVKFGLYLVLCHAQHHAV